VSQSGGRSAKLKVRKILDTTDLRFVARSRLLLSHLMVDRLISEGRKVEMGLNIKNREAHLLAEELSKLTGESMTTAVTIALRERLARIRQQQGFSLADRLLAIGRDCAARLKEPFRSADHGDLLYDERGLPR
jgi:antitoxin VapB